MPFESSLATNHPGKLALLTSQAHEENLANFNRLLSGFTGYAGIYSAREESFTDNINSLSPVLDVLNNKNLFFVLGAQKANADQISKKSNAIFNNIVIDDQLDTASIKRNLQQLIALAKLHGQVLGYAGSYPLTINLLAEWIPSLIEHGVELVPVSTMHGGIK
jgi:polysaccharide deacetylase 2 family uncharacterized protein YibQ